MSANRKYKDEEIYEEIEIESSHIDNDDIDKILLKEKRIKDKYTRLEMNKFSKFIKQMKLAINLIKDFRNKSYTQVPWRTIALISAAILYFINPFDAVPDILPVFGIADDAVLFAAVFKSIQSDLEKYGKWKGINTENYF